MSAEHAGLMMSGVAAGEPSTGGQRRSVAANGVTVSRAPNDSPAFQVNFRIRRGWLVVSSWLTETVWRSAVVGADSVSGNKENGPTLSC